MSNYSRKYPNVTGWWVYVIKTPDNMYYPGYSGGEDGNKQISDRWQPKYYKSTALKPYLNEWENLEKIIVTDGLTKDQAKDLEDQLICMYKQLNCCLNKQRSGHRSRKEILNEYNNSEKGFQCRLRYRQSEKGKETIYKCTHTEEFKQHQKEYNRQYRETHKEERNKYDKQYREDHKEEIKEKKKVAYSKPENKIYARVNSFNKIHPELKIETGSEAKNKYLEYGYIPSYIKNNDLI